MLAEFGLEEWIWRPEASGWWLVAGGWWLVAGGWWLVAGGWWLVGNTTSNGDADIPTEVGSRPIPPP